MVGQGSSGMTIVVHGDPNKTRAVKRFRCDYCGCVFDAEKGEYQSAEALAQQKDNLEAYSMCPCCRRKVWREFGEVITA